MPDQLSFEFNVGLSEEEKRDLEEMIHDFQKSRASEDDGDDILALKQQLDTANDRLAHLTSMMLTFDERIKPLNEILRLTFEKS